eukprot:TRINITY_DN10665_c0_g2_i1.p2 TRINITY_DN10665_c0_g2~~TRINITY_DN10665_c0_g2_i1.p2  ORF type:complete len:116 (+),score=31.71 TRINITY_DN10665_c0_g2_i1:1065-1412(+)
MDLPTLWVLSSTSAQALTLVAKGTVYRQGLTVGSKSGMDLPKQGVRETCYLAKARDASPLLDGSLDDFRFYNRALSQAEVQDAVCQGNAQDSSANAWHGQVVISSQQVRMIQVAS